MLRDHAISVRVCSRFGVTAPKERVAIYIDGFNLFYGMRAKGWRRYYWLDLRNFADNLLKPHHRFEMMHYLNRPRTKTLIVDGYIPSTTKSFTSTRA